MLKALFPVCASSGPLFMVMGFLLPSQAPYGYFIAVPGALMTSAALHIIFRTLTALERAPSTIQQSNES